MERPMRLPQTLSEYVADWWTGTLEQLADQLGISKGHLSRLVNGERQPSLELAVRINKLTGVPIESLTQPKTDDAGKAVA